MKPVSWTLLKLYPYITEGIGEDIIPANYDFSVIDHFEKVTDKDAALMTRDITRKEGFSQDILAARPFQVLFK
jgi:cysteine synthase